MGEPSQREAALVARAWCESGADPSLRVRLTMTTDVTASGADETVVTSIPAAVAAVEDWLSRYLGEG
jgi:hypothetical protein